MRFPATSPLTNLTVKLLLPLCLLAQPEPVQAQIALEAPRTILPDDAGFDSTPRVGARQHRTTTTIILAPVGNNLDITLETSAPAVNPVEITGIGMPEGLPIGLLDPAQGGFGPDLWTGSAKQEMAPRLDRLSLTMPQSAVMSDLVNRLVLTKAASPAGNLSAASFLARRFARLYQAGDIASLIMMGKTLPDLPPRATARLYVINAHLAAGQPAPACKQAITLEPHIATLATAARNQLLEIQAFCAAFLGDNQTAQFLARLAEEQGSTSPAFLALIEQATGGARADIDFISRLRPVDDALFRLAGRDLPENALSLAHPALYTRLARNLELPLIDRIRAVEKLYIAGIVSVRGLSAVYKKYFFTDADQISGKTRLEQLSGPDMRAFLYRYMQAETDPEKRAAALVSTLKRAAIDRSLFLVLDVNQQVISELPPVREAMWFAPEIIESLILLGETAQTRLWLDAFGLEPGIMDGRDPVGLALFDRLSFLVSLESPHTTAGAWDMFMISSGNQAITPRLRAVARAFGLAVPDPDPEPGAALPDEILLVPLVLADRISLQPAAEATTTPAPAAAAVNYDAITDAAATGKRGATLLLALNALGAGGPAAAGPELLETIIKAFVRLGLDGEARMLAREALIMGDGIIGS